MGRVESTKTDGKDGDLYRRFQRIESSVQDTERSISKLETDNAANDITIAALIIRIETLEGI